MIGHVVCLENNPKSIEKYLPVIERHQLHSADMHAPIGSGEFLRWIEEEESFGLCKSFRFGHA
jgi:hypothetical protein